ncbi:hypothetical protein LWI29_025486 [Acer saccharum]|uniref:Uncharacterized protein n=1 Tax=Acer saccharum TaxID=4024 RepID=A0AA39TVL6_ACESA|nr:hypothetical protein LWI29_025486 [Acer saccharum]
MRKAKRKASQKREESKAAAEENNHKEAEEEAEVEVDESKTATNKAPRAKRVKASKPEAETEYFEDQRNLEDLWKAVFPVGTEWDQLDSVYQYNWNFSNLEDAFEEGGKLYGRKFISGVVQSLKWLHITMYTKSYAYLLWWLLYLLFHLLIRLGLTRYKERQKK